MSIEEELARWVACNILPHEPDVRARLRRAGVAEDEVGDIIQDTYVALARLGDVAHIRSGRAYFMTSARMALLQRIRRQKIVRIDAMSDLIETTLADDQPGADRIAQGREELARVRTIIAGLPDRCREIFELRRVEGMRQRDVATKLKIPEHIVEAQVARGIRLILKALNSQDGQPVIEGRGRHAGR